MKNAFAMLRVIPFLVVLASVATPALAEPDYSRLSLSQALDRAREANRDIRAARRAVEAADAAVETAGGRPNPTLSLNSTGINVNSGIGGGPLGDKRMDSVLRLDQPFELGGKRELRLGQARASLEASGADLADMLRQQLLAVRLAYWDLKSAGEKVRLTRESADLMATTLTKNELRLAAGDIAPADLERIRIDVLRAAVDARQAQTDARRARAALVQLIAAELQVDRVAAVDPWPEPAALTAPAAAADAAVAGRPDIAAATARLEAARQGRALAETLRTRDVTVGVQYERNPPDGRNLVGVGIAIPLFTGYDFGGEIRRAYSDLGLAEETLERVRATAAAEVDRLGEEAAAAADRARLYRDRILPAARKSAAAVELAYTHGAAGVLDLLDARRTLRATELDAVSALADFAKAVASLEAARYTEKHE